MVVLEQGKGHFAPAAAQVQRIERDAVHVGRVQEAPVGEREAARDRRRELLHDERREEPCLQRVSCSTHTGGA